MMIIINGYAAAMITRPTRHEVTHDRIVDVAARTLRRNGYAGVGVADVMKQAGLTHGGFYAHFKSRDALLAEAIERAGRDSAANIGRRIDAARTRGHSALRGLIQGYLSDEHLSSAETGCVVAATSSEMPRQSAALRALSSARVNNLIAMVNQALPNGGSKEQATVIAATMVGALQMARTLGANTRGKALLAAARKALLAQHDTE
jgi:AcrR family transcriptional regulator